MKTLLFIGSLLLFFFIALLGFAAYVNNLDNELPPLEDTEKKGRAKYLIDARWPSINLRSLFSQE